MECRIVEVDKAPLSKVTIIPAGGRKYLLISHEGEWISRMIIQTGGFETALWHECKRYIDPERHILDIGANLGAFTLDLAAETKRKIYCFEPQYRVYLQLCANLLLNNVMNAVPMNIGLGDYSQDNTKIGIYDTPDYNQGMTRMVGSNVPSTSENEKVVDQVSVRALDSILDEPVGFIKLDVEGFELFVLQGAVKLIERDHPIILLECFEDRRTGKPFQFLEKMGYFFVPAHHGRHDFFAIHKEDQRHVEARSLSYLADVFSNRQKSLWAENLELLALINISHLRDEDRYSYYEELYLAQWYTEPAGYKPEVQITIDAMLQDLASGLLDQAWLNQKERIKSNLQFIPVQNTKPVETIETTNFLETIAKIRATPGLLQEKQIILVASDYDPESYWALPLMNPRIQSPK
jgi:FkbM family methyltransferase